MLINYLGNLCNFYSSIKPRSLFSSSQNSSSGEIEKQGLLPCSTWNAISTQTSRPREELIFTALATMDIRKHDRLESTSSECIQEAPYCGIPQIPIKLQKIWSHQYNSAPCQHYKQEVLVIYFRPECPKPTPSGDSLALSFLSLEVNRVDPRPQLNPCLTARSPAGHFCPSLLETHSSNSRAQEDQPSWFSWDWGVF